jgi:hypothetical protein
MAGLFMHPIVMLKKMQTLKSAVRRALLPVFSNRPGSSDSLMTFRAVVMASA